MDSASEGTEKDQEGALRERDGQYRSSEKTKHTLVT
jgi:hypothetical protein